MKKAETKDRIKAALETRGMKQSELVEKTKIDKGQMSSYLTGRYKPKQTNLHLIAEALSVDEAWLMGFDVPMERNGYVDPRIAERDGALEDIENILTSAGYRLECENYDADYFLVKNQNGQTIAGYYDYELLSKYTSLKKKGIVTAQLLISSDTAFLKFLESLGYHLYKDDPEHKPFLSSQQGYPVRLEYNTLNTLKNQIEKYAIATIELKILSLKEKEFRKERLEKERLIQHLQEQNINDGSQFKKDWDANAAHERTDIEVNAEMHKADDDMMDDDNF